MQYKPGYNQPCSALIHVQQNIKHQCATGEDEGISDKTLSANQLDREE